MIPRAGGGNVFSPATTLSAAYSPQPFGRKFWWRKTPEAIEFSVANDEQVEATRSYLKLHFPEVKAVADDRLIFIGADQVRPGSWGNIDAVPTIAEGLYPGKV